MNRSFFWDTSAFLKLLIEEAHSDEVWTFVREPQAEHFAWDWMPVEAMAAMTRRRMPPTQKTAARQLIDGFQLAGIPSSRFRDLIAFNNRRRLRAADAGHLFCWKTLRSIRPSLRLVCYDRGLANAARALARSAP